VTHAFFKACLFLGSGSVIHAMHGEQDMRKMGGLKKYMPITYWTSLIGSLALIGFPFFSGFFSKDSIIEAVRHSHIAGSGIAFVLVLLGVFITAFYSFRLFFMVFHGEERMDKHTKEHLKESPWVVTLPLIALAIPSVLTGFLMDPIIVGDFFKGVITVLPEHDSLALVREHGSHGAVSFVLHGFQAPAVYLAFAGLGAAWFIYMRRPDIATTIAEKFSFVHKLLMNKYYLDDFNQTAFAGGATKLGGLFSKYGDTKFIDGLVVNGSAGLVGLTAGIVRKIQRGFLYEYAFAMIFGLIALIGWFVLRV